MQIGPYTVERELGRGGMGAVYLARQSPTSPPMAIKVIHADLSLDEDFAARFEREGAALERLDHPNLVALRGRGTYRGGRWLAMDYVPGGSLEERLKLKGPWPSHAARELLISLCAGIAHAHGAGILHRDLKPANVLLRAQDGQALIADFGLALPLDVSQHLTRTGEVLGSPGYLAPEQCGLDQPTSPATDVYGLGALLYCVLTGQPPLRGSSLLAMLDKVVNEAPQPPSQLVANLDPALEAICLRCVAKDPGERYPSVLELQRALQTEPAPPAPKGRGPLWAALAALAALALFLGVWLGGSSDTAPSSAASPAPETPTPAMPAGTPAATPAANPVTTPDPQRAQPGPFEEALARRDWAQARTLLPHTTGTEGLWLRYRLLEAELDWTGNESESWSELKGEALSQVRIKSADPREARWRNALGVMLICLRDPRGGAGGANRPGELLRRLREVVAESETAQRRAALWRAIVSVELRHASPRDPALLSSIESWEREGGVSWQTHLARAKAAQRANEGKLLLDALRAGELAAAQAGHPWARFEFYRLRLNPNARPTPVHARLSEAILESSAPPSFKAQSALNLASYTARDLRKPKRAAKLLRDHPPPARMPSRFRATWWQARAVSELDSGNPQAVLGLLEDAERFTGVKAHYRDQLLRACAHTLLQQDQLAAAALEEALRPRQPSPVIQLLELRTWILVADRERAQALTQELLSQDDEKLYMSALTALELLLDLEVPQGGAPLVSDPSSAREVARAINLALKPGRHALARRLIRLGRWEAAVELLKRLQDAKDSPKDSSRSLRLCYQALRRGLGDVAPSDPRWQAAKRYSLRFLAISRSEKPKPILRALLESLDEVSAERRREFTRVFKRAARSAPLWEEFAEATARLTRRSLLEPALATRHSRRLAALEAADYWAKAFPESLEAKFERLIQKPDASIEEFQALSTQGSGISALGWRILMTLRSRQLAAGLVSPGAFLRACDGLTSGPLNPLPRDRRKSLVLICELLGQGTSGSALETRRLLDWSDATAGPCERSKDPLDGLLRTRSLIVQAHAALSLDRVDEALSLTKALDPYPALVSPLAKSAIDLFRGKLEVRAGVPGALERIRRGVEAAPTREGLLVLARASRGESRSRAYEYALAFPASDDQIAQTLGEIEAAGLDPGRLLQRGLRTLETHEDSRPFAYATLLFRARPDATRALLLCRALRALEYADRDRGMDAGARERSLLREALALLPPDTQALIRAQGALERLMSQRDSEKIAQALRDLQDLPGSVELRDHLRIPSSIAAARQTQGSKKGALERAEQVLAPYVARGRAPARVEFWLAERYRERGELERSRKLSTAGLARLPALGRRSSGWLFQAALDASAAGDEGRAIELLNRILSSTESHSEIAKVSLTLAELRTRRGELHAAIEAVAVVKANVRRTNSSFQIRLFWVGGQIQLQGGRLKEARSLLQQGWNLSKRAAPKLRASGKALEAAILNAEQEHDLALAASEAALELYERELLAHLTHLDALIGVGDKERALAEAKSLLEGSLLNPGGKAQIEAWLEKQ
jgi:protein kinase-like protein